jgi:hypothetical protein
MHGGARGSGGPHGEANGRYVSGWYTKHSREERRELGSMVRAARAFARSVTGD